MIRGIGVAEGIAIGKALVKQEIKMDIVRQKVENATAEFERFNVAAEKCRIELERRYNKTVNMFGKEEAEFYKHHLTVFDGSILLGQVRKEIQEQGVNAEYILMEVMKKYASMFDKVADEFLKKKSQSIRYIAEQIIRELIGVEETSFNDVQEATIVIAQELDGTDIVQMDKNKVLAVATEVGSKNSLHALLTTDFNIPVIVGVKKVMSQVSSGDTVIVDGTKGEIFINPDEATLKFYRDKINKEKELEGIYQTFIHEDARTIDGYEFDLTAVCPHTYTIAAAKENGAKTVGLFKTEFLFFGRDQMPSEEVQLEAYREAVTLADGEKVIFRVFDCTTVSKLPYIYFHEERNPEIGYRSIRILLNERELFVKQLVAMLQTSAYGPIGIALPMITTMEELLDAKVAFEEAKLSLDERGIMYDKNVELGLIVDTPVTAVMADMFAREVDFVIIGSNRLVQFMTAVDRGNEQLFELFDIYNPGIIRTIKNVIVNSHREGTWVGITGEVANSEYLLPLLIAFGIDQVSMTSTMIGKGRWIASRTDKAFWEKEADKIIHMNSGNEVKLYLEKVYHEEIIWKEL